MQIDTASLREKLGKLVPTQESIEQTSTWCCLFRADAKKLATEWEKVFRENEQPKRLTLIYLANDIVQVGRTIPCPCFRSKHSMLRTVAVVGN